MVRTIVWICAALFLPGCLSSPTHITGPTDPSVITLEGLLPVWSHPPFNATETTIVSNRQGTIFFGAAEVAGDAGKAPIFRSRDAGRTWTEVTPRLPTGERAPLAITDPFIHLDRDTGRLFGLTMQPTRSCGQLVWSDDEGQTWLHNPHACGNLPIYDHQSITTGSPRILPTVGYPNIVYQCYNRVTDTPCARSLDGGITWAALASPFAGADANPRPTDDPLGPVCGGLAGQLHATRDGTVLLPREHCGRAKLAMSRDDGTTWTVHTLDPEALRHGPDPVVTSDASNRIYYAWLDAKGTLRLRWSADQGASWSPARDLTPPNMTAHLPAIAAHGDGRLALNFLATDDIPGGFRHPEFQTTRSSRAPDGVVNKAVWYPYIGLLDDARDPNERLRILQASPSEDPINRGDCDPRYCASSYGDYQGITVRPDGLVVASYADHCVADCLKPSATYRDNTPPNRVTPAGLTTVLAWEPSTVKTS